MNSNIGYFIFAKNDNKNIINNEYYHLMKIKKKFLFNKNKFKNHLKKNLKKKKKRKKFLELLILIRLF